MTSTGQRLRWRLVNLTMTMFELIRNYIPSEQKRKQRPDATIQHE